MQSGQYPDDWPERRRHVYQRDNYTCQSCGRGGGPNGDAELHAHHITPLSHGGSNHLSNLVTLCRECHNAQHEHDITADYPQQTASSSSWIPSVEGIVTALGRHIVVPLVFVFAYIIALDEIASYAQTMGELGSILATLVVGTIGLGLGLVIPFIALKAYVMLSAILIWYFGFEVGVDQVIQMVMEGFASGPVWLVAIDSVVSLYAVFAPGLVVASICLTMLTEWLQDKRQEIGRRVSRYTEK